MQEQKTMSKVQGKPITAGDDPEGFVNRFFQNSRLHFIGRWRERYQALLATEGPKATSVPAIPEGESERVICHIDLDAFFATASTRHDPVLQQQPVAVAWGNGDAAEISSCNYKAREYGVHAGMPIGRAKELVPSIVQLQYDFELYTEIAADVYRAFWQTTPHVQGVSCDEAYLDLTAQCSDAESTVQSLRQDIYQRTGCTASAGIGPNRLLAGVATRQAKPNGQLHVDSSTGKALISKLPVEHLPGVASKTRQQLNAMGIYSCSNLQNTSKERLKHSFGSKRGASLWELAHGTDNRPWEEKPKRRSIGAQCTWGVRFASQDEVREFINNLAHEVSRRLNNANAKGRTVAVQLMRQVENAPEHARKGALGHGVCDSLSRSMTLANFTDSKYEIAAEAKKIVHELDVPADQVRGLGIQVSRLNTEKGNEFSGTIRRANVSAAGKRSRYNPKKPPDWAGPWLKSRTSSWETHGKPSTSNELQQRSMPYFTTQQQHQQRQQKKRPAYQRPSLNEIDTQVLEELPQDVRKELQSQLAEQYPNATRVECSRPGRNDKRKRGIGPMDTFLEQQQKNKQHKHNAHGTPELREQQQDDALNSEWRNNERDPKNITKDRAASTVESYQTARKSEHEAHHPGPDADKQVDAEGQDEEMNDGYDEEDDDELAAGWDWDADDEVIPSCEVIKRNNDEGGNQHRSSNDNDESNPDAELLEQSKAEVEREFWHSAVEDAAELLTLGQMQSDLSLEPYAKLIQLVQHRCAQMSTADARKALIQFAKALGSNECADGTPGSRWCNVVAPALLPGCQAQQ